MGYYGFAPYVPVAQRQANAAREMAKLTKKGHVISPVTITGKTIAASFWGQAWCDNLRTYSDEENRLSRGQTYVRNGSVCDLQIERGLVRARVSGTSLYSITIEIATLPKTRWDAICRDCAGSVGSLVELLQGKLSKNVMERVCRRADGLFPRMNEIKLRCSCPDSARMCKHVAATLYGVGARLDARPEFLFELRGVDRSQLIANAGKGLPIGNIVSSERMLVADDLSAMFGIEMDDSPRATPAPSTLVRKDPAKSEPVVKALPIHEGAEANSISKTNVVKPKGTVKRDAIYTRATSRGEPALAKPGVGRPKIVATATPASAAGETSSGRRTPILKKKYIAAKSKKRSKT